MNASETLSLASEWHRAGRLDDAAALYRQILSVEAGNVNALYLLSLALYSKKQFAEALPLIERATAVQSLPELHGHHGLVLAALDRTDDAIAAYQRALTMRPDYAEALFNLGGALCLKERWNDAIAVYSQAQRFGSHDAASLGHLARALVETHRYDPAIAVYQQYLALEPRNVDGWNNLACAYKDTGRVQTAMEYYDKAVEIDPKRADLDSNRLYAMYFDPRFDGAAILREHQIWNRRHAEPLRQSIRPLEINRDRLRRLRIGYVSPDFRNHVVGRAVLPILNHHDHERLEVFAYSSAAKPDAMTGRLKACCDSWRDIHAIGDDEAAQQIRDDRIDILVDLTLHMAANRLLIFARKPAPLQVTFLGYCGTTGLAAMDYRLSDLHLDPDDVDLAVYTEKTLRLPKCWWCYQPPEETPPPVSAPMLGNGFITFGCLNNFAKVSPPVLECWAGILAAAPRSRLILFCPAGSHRQGVMDIFAQRGVAADRLEFLDYQPWQKYMQTYQRLDLALDPFPYGGGITTCDALWMGVPVVTLSGRTAVGRGGRSLLANSGLNELIATTEQDYVALAVQSDRWMPVRKGLRDRLAASPVFDARRMAGDLEAAYRCIWEGYLKS